MAQAEIRQIPIDRLATDYAPLHRYAFFPSPPLNVDSYESQRVLYEKSTNLGMYEGDRAVATAISIPMTQNVRGKIFPMAGVAGVTSSPTTRRQGYVKQLMTRLFTMMHETGTAVSTLYPFRESFYERLGYAMFAHMKAVKMKTADMKPLIDMDLSGDVDLVNQSEGWDFAKRMLKTYQSATHGVGLFEDDALKYLYGHDRAWLAIARDDAGTIIGTMVYRITEFRGTIEISRFFPSNALARYLLLQFIAKHIDQVYEVHIKELPGWERPETWFSDLHVTAEPDIWITPMGRVMDLMQLNGMTVGDGDIRLAIEDPVCSWNQGVYHLKSEDGKLTVSPGEEPECTLSIQALSGLVYGTHNPHDFRWRGWGNPNEAIINRLLQLFPPATPFLMAKF